MGNNREKCLWKNETEKVNGRSIHNSRDIALKQNTEDQCDCVKKCKAY